MFVISIGLTFRVVGASFKNQFTNMKKPFTRVNYPFDDLTQKIKSQTGFTGGLIVSNNRFIAGNLHLHFPDSTAIIPNYRFELLPDAARYKTAIAIWNADRFPHIPDELATFLKKIYHINESDFQVKYFSLCYKYGRTEKIKFGVIRFPVVLANEDAGERVK